MCDRVKSLIVCIVSMNKFKLLSMILLTILSGLLLHRIIKRTKVQKRRIYFVGPRSTGKTTAICSILLHVNDKKIRQIKRTVPSRETHLTTINNLEIVEVQQSEEENDIKKFSINGRDRFIFFMKSSGEETYPSLSGFDVTFVVWKKTAQKTRKDIVYLEEDPMKIIELIYNE